MTVSVTLDVEFDTALTDPDSMEYQDASAAVIAAFIEVTWRYLTQMHRQITGKNYFIVYQMELIRLVGPAHRIVMKTMY